MLRLPNETCFGLSSHKTIMRPQGIGIMALGLRYPRLGVIASWPSHEPTLHSQCLHIPGRIDHQLDLLPLFVLLPLIIAFQTYPQCLSRRLPSILAAISDQIRDFFC